MFATYLIVTVLAAAAAIDAATNDFRRTTAMLFRKRVLDC